MSLIVIPCTSLRSNRLSIYNRYEGGNRRRRRDVLEVQRLAAMLTQPAGTGADAYEAAKEREGISKKAAKRLSDAICTLVACSRRNSLYCATSKKYVSFRCNLVTLTLPSAQVHTDKEIHAGIFTEFIRAWKRKAPDLLYVWKAETQENGNLHYHLVTNTYIHHTLLRRMWNFYCEKLGYCSRSSSSNPNSTDVHAVRSVRDTAAYCIKYMAKKEEGRRVPTIRKWYCSKALLTPHPVIEGSDTGLQQELTYLCTSTRRIWYGEYCTVIFNPPYRRDRCPRLTAAFIEYIELVKRKNRHLPD